MDLPKLTFIYAYPLDEELRRSFEERGQVYPSRDEVREVMQRWDAIWTEVNSEHRILERLAELTQRVPSRNLECFIFGRGLTPKSTPFMLPIWNRQQAPWSEDKFIDLMIHELLHIYLATDNDVYWEMAKERYAAEEPVTRNHVLLYAMLNQMYQDLWRRDPMDFTRDNLPPGYARAIEIVAQAGYTNLIKEYRALVNES